MDLYFIVKTLHILSSTILFGTGIGIAFFMFRSHFTTDLNQKLYASKNTILADYFFTFPAVIIQPITGLWLISIGHYNSSEFWLIATYIIYLIVGLCWLPVVWIQIQLKKMLLISIQNNTVLPGQYHQFFKVWCLLGIPAFAGLVIIFFLMVGKPI